MRAQKIATVLPPRRLLARCVGPAAAAVVALELLHVAEPLLLRALVDEAGAARRVSALVLLAALIGAVHFGRAGAATLHVRLSAAAGSRIGVHVRQRLFERVQDSSNALASGDLLHRLMSDVATVEKLFGDVLLRAIALGVAFLAATGALFFVDARMALGALALCPIVATVAARLRAPLDASADQSERARAALSTFYETHIGALDEVRAGGRARWQARLAWGAAAGVARADVERARAASVFTGTFELLLAAASTAVLAAGVVGLCSGNVTLGSLVALYFFVAQLLGTTVAASGFASEAAETRAALARIGELAAAPPPPRGTTALPDGPIGVEARALSVRYGAEREAIRGIDLDVAPGDHVALVGPCGSGKSTLLRVIAGLVRPSAGFVRVGRIDVTNVAPASRAAAVAYASQTPTLIDASLAENITLGDRRARARAISAARTARLAPDLVSRLEVARAGERGSALSGGERQAIALARVFSKDPRIVLVDEPTSAMDPVAERAVWDAIFAFARGRTLIAAVHAPEIAARFPRRILLADGAVVRSSAACARPEKADSGAHDLSD